LFLILLLSKVSSFPLEYCLCWRCWRIFHFHNCRSIFGTSKVDAV